MVAAVAGSTTLEQMDDGERQLLLLEVGAQALAGDPLLAPDIEHVVGDLESDAQVAAIAIECRDGRLGRAGVGGTQAARDGGQFGRLALDDREVVAFVEVEVAAMVDLLHFPLADLVGRVADPAAGAGRVERGGQVEGVGEEIVAQQDGRLVAPLGIDGGGMPPDHGLIEHVVMHERGRVDHLHDGRQHGVGLGERAARPAGQRSTSAGRSRLP